MAQIDESSIKVAGVIGSAGLVIWRVVIWILGLNSKVDKHTDQLVALEKSLENSDHSRTALHEKMNALDNRTIVIETKLQPIEEKLDLIIEKLIK